jgi:hypothetical protein
MVKSYVILLLFVFCNLTNGEKVEVEFDSVNKMIIYNGEIYLPFKNKNTDSEENISFGIYGEKYLESGKIKSHPEVHEELSETKFWFYIVMIGCKKIIKF